jgi:type VI secretion system protein ImpM
VSGPVVSPVLAAGWFGKLPGLGDFVQRRLPPSFVTPWDEWLQRGLHALDAQPREEELEPPAPVRRFWLDAGVVDACGWAGLLMASRDRSGRAFPLTVAQPMATLAQSLAARPWASSLVAAMRFTHDREHTLDDFEECLHALPPPPVRRMTRADEALAAALRRDGTARSVWWCHGAAKPADFLVFDGMPPPAALAQLLGRAG